MDREREIHRLVELVGIYFGDAERCAQNKLFRPACVMIAAALEAGLLALAYRFPDAVENGGPWPDGRTQPARIILADLCAFARRAGWLSPAPPGVEQPDDDALADDDVDDMLKFVAEARNIAVHPGRVPLIDVDDAVAFEVAYTIVKTAFDMTYWTVLAPDSLGDD